MQLIKIVIWSNMYTWYASNKIQQDPTRSNNYHPHRVNMWCLQTCSSQQQCHRPLHRPQVPKTNSSLLREPSHCQQLLHLCLSETPKVWWIPFLTFDHQYGMGWFIPKPLNRKFGFGLNHPVVGLNSLQVNWLKPNLAIQPEKPGSAENNLHPSSVAQSPLSVYPLIDSKMSGWIIKVWPDYVYLFNIWYKIVIVSVQ